VIIESDLSDIAKTQFILPMLDRSVSYPANSWEYPPVKSGSNYTYYIPLRDEMKGARIDAVVLGLKKGLEQFKSEVWITAYPAPYSEQLLSLVEGA
jgi:hypothetical protein